MFLKAVSRSNLCVSASGFLPHEVNPQWRAQLGVRRRHGEKRAVGWIERSEIHRSLNADDLVDFAALYPPYPNPPDPI
jgi:hypothetical protein